MSERVWNALVVDDFPDAGEALVAWLTLEGCRAESMTSAEAALARIDAQMPDVLIIEPYLRHGSAMSMAAHVRHRFGAAIWMVAVTGHPRVGDAIAYEPTLFDRTLVKPCDEQHLRAALRDAQFRNSFSRRTGAV